MIPAPVVRANALVVVMVVVAALVLVAAAIIELWEGGK